MPTNAGARTGTIDSPSAAPNAGSQWFDPSSWFSKGGLVKRFAEGGQVRDPMQGLLEALQDGKITYGERGKFARQSTHVEDRRGAPGPMSPDAKKASRIPMGPESGGDIRSILEALGMDYVPDTQKWYTRDDPEANLYMALRFGTDDPQEMNDIRNQSKASNAMRYGSKYAKGGKVKGFAGGGDVIKHDGSLEELLGATGDPSFTPRDGLNQSDIPVSYLLDPEDVLRLAVTKHESGAKDYENINYDASAYKTMGPSANTHAFGIGQWQPDRWNAMAANPRNNLSPVTAKDIEAGRFPSRDEQDRAWGIWSKILKNEVGDDPVDRFR